MKVSPAFFLLTAALLPQALPAKKAVSEYPATYAGGSLPLVRHRIYAALDADEVVFTQRGRRVAVPVKDITAISCGTEVRRRLGASVLDVVPLMHLGESQDRYVGVAWAAAGGDAPRTQVLLKFNRGEYSSFLAALERATGIKAVDTNRVPTAVRY